MSLKSDLYAYLKSQSTITNLVGSGDNARIYPKVRPQGSALPAITFERASGGNQQNLEAAAGWADPVFDITAWAADDEGAEALAEVLRGEMQGFRGTWTSTTVHAVILEDQDDFYESRGDGNSLMVHAVSMDFRIQVTESVPTF